MSEIKIKNELVLFYFLKLEFIFELTEFKMSHYPKIKGASKSQRDTYYQFFKKYDDLLDKDTIIRSDIIKFMNESICFMMGPIVAHDESRPFYEYEFIKLFSSRKTMMDALNDQATSYGELPEDKLLSVKESENMRVDEIIKHYNLDAGDYYLYDDYFDGTYDFDVNGRLYLY